MIVLLRSASRQDKYGPCDVESIIHAAANKISFGNKFSTQQNEIMTRKTLHTQTASAFFTKKVLPLPFFLLIYDIITWSEHNNLEAHLQHHLFRPRVLIKYNWSITSKSPSQPSPGLLLVERLCSSF